MASRFCSARRHGFTPPFTESCYFYEFLRCTAEIDWDAGMAMIQEAKMVLVGM